MHELAIAQSIIDVVEERARACQAAQVRRVRLQVGDASGIVAEALTGSFELLAGLSSLLEGAHLMIDRIPHRARCRQCEREFAVKNFVPLCPLCQEWSSDILSGTECQILEMEIIALPTSGSEE